MPPTNLPLHVLMTIHHITAPHSTGILIIIPTTLHGPLREVTQISTTTPQIHITILTIILRIVSPLHHHHICVERTLTSPLLIVKLTMAPQTDTSGKISKTSTRQKYGRKMKLREGEICLAEIKEIPWRHHHCMGEVGVVKGVWPWTRLPTEQSWLDR